MDTLDFRYSCLLKKCYFLETHTHTHTHPGTHWCSSGWFRAPDEVCLGGRGVGNERHTQYTAYNYSSALCYYIKHHGTNLLCHEKHLIFLSSHFSQVSLRLWCVSIPGYRWYYTIQQDTAFPPPPPWYKQDTTSTPPWYKQDTASPTTVIQTRHSLPPHRDTNKTQPPPHRDKTRPSMPSNGHNPPVLPTFLGYWIARTLMTSSIRTHTVLNTD